MLTCERLLLALALVATLFCAGCVGEGETDFRPTPGIVNLNY